MLKSEPLAEQSVSGLAQNTGSTASVTLAVLALLVGSCLIRLIDLGSPPYFDEMYTVGAAQGWMEEGAPTIGGGVYDRALAYTIIVASAFSSFGDSVVVARLVSVLAGSLLVVAVFLWTRSVAGNTAAWIAALFVALSPSTVQISQFARFYALQGLVFWVAAAGVYYLWAKRLEIRLAIPLAIACVLGFLFALHLQILTAIGLVGVLSWLGIAIGWPLLMQFRARPAALWGVIGGLALLGAAVLAAAILSGLLDRLIDIYRDAPLHAQKVKNQVWFYHLALIGRYPSLWPLFPVAALIAIAARPRPALFCLSVFVPGFLILSFGAMKQFNYITFLMPYLFVLWSIAMAAVLTRLREWIVAATDGALQAVAPDLPRRPARYVLIAGCALFLILANGAPARTLLLPLGVKLTPEGAPVDWAGHRDTLQPLVDEASIVLTADEMALLYYLGRADVTVSGSRMSEVDDADEFVVDGRTGMPIISSVQSAEQIMSCFPHGVVLTNARKWRDPAQIDNAVADLIEGHGQAIAMPRGARIAAYSWGETGIEVAPEVCTRLSELISGK